jgi:hypothetical protein
MSKVDVMGKASRAILEAVVAGESDPRRLADLAIGRVRARPEERERALTGKVTAHQRFLLSEHLRQIGSFEAAIRRVSEEIARRFSLPDPPPEAEAGEDHDQPQSAAGSAPEEPHPPAGLTELTWQEAVELIDQITGSSERAAQGMLAELGRDMSRFASAKHLAS